MKSKESSLLVKKSVKGKIQPIIKDHYAGKNQTVDYDALRVLCKSGNGIIRSLPIKKTIRKR